MLRELPRIERLDLAVLGLPDWHPEASNQASVRVFGYVIVHPDGPILFDTGVGFGNAFIDAMYEPDCAPLDQTLAAVGVQHESIVGVVNSHLHFDHCGQNPLLFGSDVPFYMRQLEVNEVERDRFYTDPEWALPPAPQRRVIDGDVEIAEGVTIVPTPGHTPGHQSIVVESAAGCAVLAGQVVWTLAEFVKEQATVSNVFSESYHDVAIDSICRIKAFKPESVFFAHCEAFRHPGSRMAPDE